MCGHVSLPMLTSTREKGNGDDVGEGDGAREGRDERRVSRSETAKRRDGHISGCTRCPDLVYFWVSSLDGIQLPLLRLSTRSSVPAPLINNGKFDDNKKELDKKRKQEYRLFPRMEKRTIICKATITIQSLCDLSPAAGKLCTGCHCKLSH